jgi:Polyketide cyclase / dehydrase and lipid transport
VGSDYLFVDRWFVHAPLETTYETIGDTLGYPDWWGDVFVSVEGDGGPPRAGRHVRIVSRGFLPYLLRWEAEITEAEAPARFAFMMTGDFVGSGSWRFDAAGDGTNAVFDFRPRVEKAGVKQLSPVLKPLFRWNHRWAMNRGERGVNALFANAAASAGEAGGRHEDRERDDREGEPRPPAPDLFARQAVERAHAAGEQDGADRERRQHVRPDDDHQLVLHDSHRR